MTEQEYQDFMLPSFHNNDTSYKHKCNLEMELEMSTSLPLSDMARMNIDSSFGLSKSEGYNKCFFSNKWSRNDLNDCRNTMQKWSCDSGRYDEDTLNSPPANDKIVSGNLIAERKHFNLKISLKDIPVDYISFLSGTPKKLAKSPHSPVLNNPIPENSTYYYNHLNLLPSVDSWDANKECSVLSSTLKSYETSPCDDTKYEEELEISDEKDSLQFSMTDIRSDEEK